MTYNEIAALKIKDNFIIEYSLLDEYRYKGIERIKNRTRKNAKKHINKFLNKKEKGSL